MNYGASQANPIASIIMFIVVATIVVLRNSRPRKLRVEFLWVRPVIVLVFGALYFYFFPPRSVAETLGLVAAFAVGGVPGWWRGRSFRIDVDAKTHLATQQASVVGMLFIIGLFAVRYLLSYMARSGGMNLPIPAYALSGLLIAFAFGIVIVAQLEVWLRARRLIAEAKSKAA